jgi:tetratricopeptide (TPR) repeat protein
MKTVFLWSGRFLFLIALLYSGAHMSGTWRWNLWAIQLLKNDRPEYPLETKSCAQKWLSGVVAGKRGDLANQRQIWIQSLACSQQYLSMLRAKVPQDQELASLATQLYPRSAQAWFWLAETSAPADRSVGARQAYLRVVELDPQSGLAWCRLGVNYEISHEYGNATQGFLKCCQNGDPGRNGCFGAGRMMEKLGNLTQAITYYRLSRFDVAQQRADELEIQISP